MVIAGNAQRRMPIAIDETVVLQEPLGRRHCLDKVAEGDAVEGMIEAGSQQVRPEDSRIDRGKQVFLLGGDAVGGVKARREEPVRRDATRLLDEYFGTVARLELHAIVSTEIDASGG